MSENLPLSDFDKLWNFQNPAATEAAFRQRLPEAEASDQPGLLPALLTQIARTQGLQKQFDAAHATLDRVEPLLQTAPPAVRIRYLLERGRVLNTSGQPQQAAPLFQQAWDLGRESGEEAYAIDAAHMLAIVAPAGEGLPWNLKALEMAESSENPRARNWLGALYNNIGWDHHDAGRFDAALEVFQRARAWREQQGEPISIRIARWSIARTLRSLGRLDESEAIQKNLKAELLAAGEHDPYVDEELAEIQKSRNPPS